MPPRRHIVITTFRAMKPTTFRKMKQDSNGCERISVSIPRLKRWCFNTKTQVLTRIVNDEQELADLTAKLKSRNIWHDYHRIV